jgi:alpha-1,6-mannosyltransferase
LKTHVPEFVALMLGAGVVYLIAVYITSRFPVGPAGLFTILSGAAVFRLLVLPATPQLSDDVYRYQWEGRIQRDHINPYTVFPALPNLRRFQDPAHPLEAGQYTPTVYPPLSEMAFSWVETVPAYKRLFTALDSASVGVLLMILAALKQPLQRVLAYAWNPTVIVSFAMCGHQDSLAIFTLLAATLLIIARKEALSGAFLALSLLSKFFAVLLLPVFFAALNDEGTKSSSSTPAPHHGAALSECRQRTDLPAANKRRARGRPSSRLGRAHLRFSAAFLVVLAMGYVPYLGAGRRIFGGLGNYAAVWEANDSIFRLVRHAGNTQAQAELVAGVVLLSLLAYVLKAAPRAANFPQAPRSALHSASRAEQYLLRSSLVVTAGLLLLSPDAFPWYFTWSIPCLCFYDSAPWLLMSITAVLGYAPVVAYAAGQLYVHSPFMLALEYGPVIAWLGWLGIRSSRSQAQASENSGPASSEPADAHSPDWGN